MKNSKKQIMAAIGVLFMAASTASNAALELRLSGLAVYDTDLDITWLANANAAAGTIFDDGLSPTDGFLSWDSAKAWAANLDISGVTGWRLPTTEIPCFIMNCDSSEMGHLFYNEIGGIAWTTVQFHHNSNYDLFRNISYSEYWSGTEHDSVNAWVFAFGGGGQYWRDKDNVNDPLLSPAITAWAVHDGDVPLGAVPEPAAYAMLLAGLLFFGFSSGRGLINKRI
ncbi:MAG: DUF1566 domain-containing protein [Proteobacteria bacterium]|nr:DUF1566 domain-containing protein [Pseudomonadota bacterium]